ncbi:unnamed protein product [Calicophoron daubneyi]|uniref:Uncharacterized protein n=1 Tax=Calicophoron daubneyi TaxID=300641 RepID=A0AAV2TVG6_CALDB
MLVCFYVQPLFLSYPLSHQLINDLSLILSLSSFICLFPIPLPRSDLPKICLILIVQLYIIIQSPFASLIRVKPKSVYGNKKVMTYVYTLSSPLALHTLARIYSAGLLTHHLCCAQSVISGYLGQSAHHHRHYHCQITVRSR